MFGRRTELALAFSGFSLVLAQARIGRAEEPTPRALAQNADVAKPRTEVAKPAEGPDKAWAPAVQPKPLTDNVKKGLKWLIDHQLPNGAWGQGEESQAMGNGMESLKDKGNVADTCMGTLALIRSGSTPSSGPYAKAIKAGLDWVMGQIEKSDRDSLSVTSVQGTRVQSKIGPYVDTFMSSITLSEAKGKMGDAAANERLGAALEKVLHKVEKNQRDNGTWEGQAWAPVLSQALGAKGLNRAAQAGAPVAESARNKAEGYARSQYDGRSKKFQGEGSAGVSLYSGAASAGAIADSVATNDMDESKVREEAKNGKDEETRTRAKRKLERYADTKRTRDDAEHTLIQRLDDPSFRSGFGSNGGEEFLSYMLVSESLVAKGGREWKEWDNSMTANLNRVQNGDGSWTGLHCITGRTFVTSAALLVLTADRAPVPLASKLKKG